MLDDDLVWLQSWFHSHCNGSWEGRHKIRIDTFDNPGWGLEVDLNETELVDRKFVKFEAERAVDDWLVCRVKQKMFQGYGGPTNLTEILFLFRLWACQSQFESDALQLKTIAIPKNDLIWLLHWFYSQCNGDWEHRYNIVISTTSTPGWSIQIAIEETELEERLFDLIDIRRAEQDWISCFIKEGHFQAMGGPMNLSEILQIFRQWAKEVRQFREL